MYENKMVPGRILYNLSGEEMSIRKSIKTIHHGIHGGTLELFVKSHKSGL